MRHCPGCQYLVPDGWDICKKCGSALHASDAAAAPAAGRASEAAPAPRAPDVPPKYRTSLPADPARGHRGRIVAGIVALVAVSIAVGALVLRADAPQPVPAGVRAYAKGAAGIEFRGAGKSYVATLPVAPIQLPQHVTVSNHDIVVHVASAEANRQWAVEVASLQLPTEFTTGGFVASIPSPVVDAVTIAVTGGGTAGKVTRVDPPARAVAAEDVDIHLLRGAHGKMRVLLTGDHQLVFAAVVSSYAGTTGFDRLVRSLHLTY